MIFKGIVLGNLIALNLMFFLGYKTVSGKINLAKSELALQVEDRLSEEYKYITNGLKTIKDELLSTQQEVANKVVKIRTSLPIQR